MFIDAPILAQAIIFPESKICLPLYEISKNHKVITSIDAFLSYMIDNFSLRKMVFANLSKKGWPDSILRSLVLNSKFPFNSRFAPTPSNQLHIGNARTALLSYLTYLAKKEISEFQLRFDDTDFEGNDQKKMESKQFEEKIKNDLSWLRINWQSTFNQSKNKAYSDFLSALQNVDFIQNVNGEYCIDNEKIPLEIYYNIYFDWKRGPIICHEYPFDRNRKTKLTKIKRNKGKNFYYRFAGIVDDIQGSTVVVRDFRQQHLTKIQNHIRHYIEKTKQKLIDANKISVLKDLNISASGSIHLPIYFHAPVVKGYSFHSRGYEILSKSNIKKHEEQLRIYYIDELKKQFLPESVIAYLLSTILTKKELRKSNWQEKTQEIINVISKFGTSKTLFHFSKVLNFDTLLEGKEEIKCDVRQIKYIDQLIIKKMPSWFLRNRIQHKLNLEKINDSQFNELLISREYFSCFGEIIDLLSSISQNNEIVISEPSKEYLQEILEPEKGIRKRIISRIDNLEKQHKKNNIINNDYSTYITFLYDLRKIFLNKSSGLPIKVILRVLPEKEIFNRILLQI